MAKGKDDASVKVAVRVRPFNSREKDRNSKLIIKMAGVQTTITNPEDGGTKTFSFDFSYQSHSGFVMQGDLAVPQEPNTENYADQQRVFDELGITVLNNAFEGFNTSLFAYGQTGSGKSYSMVGYGPNKGIVPITCDVLFQKIEANDNDKMRFEVTISMLEIYNEQVRDLLRSKNPPGGLKVRENPKVGVYVEGLTAAAVGSYKDIEAKTEEGTRNRTVASTQMNATSSRAHTVITIQFSQIEKLDDAGNASEKKSKINLVDLAGSERADSTGATGDRLKEGSAINQSLSSLGNVISALADISMGKKKVFVPYRNSVLTRILQDALGGNSKTIMIAALSPADINYEETLSTLRYADRAKKIKNKAVVNENPTDKLIRELKEENERLMKLLKEGGVDTSQAAAEGGSGGPPSEEELAKIREQVEAEMAEKLAENERLMAEMQVKFEDKLKETHDQIQESDVDNFATCIHIANLNEDPALSGVVKHEIADGETKIGNAKSDAQIQFGGLSIGLQHALITKEGDKIKIEPKDGNKTTVNGEPLEGGEKFLHHNDRLLFGNNQMFVFINPSERDAAVEAGKTVEAITWEFAQAEIAKASGIDHDTRNFSDMSPEEIEKKLVQDDLVQIMPMTQEANAISEEMNKGVKFDVKLMSVKGKTEVAVKMSDLINGNSWIWNRDKFINRMFLMREHYQNFVESDGEYTAEKEKDPFWEAASECLIGWAYIQLNSLSYLIENEDTITITDHSGQAQGALRVELLPCDKNGKSEDFDDFVEDPQELIGKRLDFLMKIPYARGIPSKFKKGVYCKWRFYLDEEFHQSEPVGQTTNPEFNYSKHVSMEAVTKPFLKYLEDDAIQIEVYGMMDERPPDALKGRNTAQLMRQDTAALDNGGILARRAEWQGQLAAGQAADAKFNESKLHAQVQFLERRLEHRSKQMRKMEKLLTEGVESGEAKGNFVVEMRKLLASGGKAKLKAIAGAIMMANQAKKAREEVEGGGEKGGKDGSKACAIQ